MSNFNLNRSLVNFSMVLVVFHIVSINASKLKIKVTVGENFNMYENTAIQESYTSTRTNTSHECFNLCRNDSNCSLISFNRTLERGFNCFLCKANQRPNINMQYVTISKDVLRPVSPYYYKYWGIRLWRHYMFERNVNDENDCFDLCVHKSECYAITYDYWDRKTCYYFKQYEYSTSEDNNFISMSRKKLDLNMKERTTTVQGPFIYENVRLFGHSTLKQAHSAVNCFDECIKDGNKCDAALYGPDNYCSLFKKGDFYVWTLQQNWKTISKERLTEEPNKYQYLGVRLYNQYDYSPASNDECSRRCDLQPECFAVAFRPSANMGCFFYKNDRYTTKKVNSNANKWKVISKDFIVINDDTNTNETTKVRNEILGPLSYKGVRLTNHYAIYTNIKSSESCFNNCTSDRKCFAAGFNQQRVMCEFYQNGQFEVESSQEWIVISKYVLELGLNSI